MSSRNLEFFQEFLRKCSRNYVGFPQRIHSHFTQKKLRSSTWSLPWRLQEILQNFSVVFFFHEFFHKLFRRSSRNSLREYIQKIILALLQKFLQISSVNSILGRSSVDYSGIPRGCFLKILWKCFRKSSRKSSDSYFRNSCGFPPGISADFL